MSQRNLGPATVSGQALLQRVVALHRSQSRRARLQRLPEQHDGGLELPLAGGELSQAQGHLPGAARHWRLGVLELAEHGLRLLPVSEIVGHATQQQHRFEIPGGQQDDQRYQEEHQQGQRASGGRFGDGIFRSVHSTHVVHV